MTDPNDIRDQFSPLLDDELSPDTRDTVEAELAQDAELLRELDAMRKVDELYRGLPRASAPDDMAGRVRNQLDQKSNVVPMRPRRISRTLYTSFAAAAIFAVLVGAVVIRQGGIVLPSADERIMASAPTKMDDEARFAESADKQIGATDASEKELVQTFGDAPEEEPSLEVDAIDPQPGRRSALAMDRDDAVQSEVRSRQESFENAPTAQAETVAPADGRMDRQNKDAAKAKPRAFAAAAPPPAPATTPAPSEAPVLGRAVGGKAVEEGLAMADAEFADQPNDIKAQVSQAKKRENVVQRIANREFDEREDGWYQRGYKGEPTQIVRRGSEMMSTLLAAIPGLNEVVALKGDVVLRHAETWYRIPGERKK